MNPFETAVDAKVREFNQMLAGLRALGLSDTYCMGEGDWHPTEPSLERLTPDDHPYSPVKACPWCGLTAPTPKQQRKLIAIGQEKQLQPEWDDKVYTHEAQAEHGTVLCQHREEHPITALYITQKGRSESLGLVYSCGARDRGNCLEQRDRFAEMGPALRLY